MSEEMKAYDFAALAIELKNKGLEIAEDSAKHVVEAVLNWIEASAKASATPYDDMALFMMPKLKEIIMKQVDKIDGKEG